MYHCGFCSFENINPRIVAHHWFECTQRKILNQGIILECDFPGF